MGDLNICLRHIVQFRSGDPPTTNHYPHAVLVQDNWDDYGYKTTFQVTLHMSADESHDLGNIKIIEVGRSSGYTEMPRQPFAELPAGHASLGAVNGGHFSYAPPGTEDRFFAIPNGLHWAEVTPDNLILVDHQGNTLEGSGGIE